MKWGIIGGVVAAVVFGVLWFSAKSDLDSRYRATLASAREIGVERTGELPSDARVRALVTALAGKNGLTASDDLEVTRREGEARQQAKGIDRMMKPAGLAVVGTTIEVKGRLSGKKMFWKLDKPFELEIVIRGNITPGENTFDASKPLPTSGDHLKRFEEAAGGRGQ